MKYILRYPFYHVLLILFILPILLPLLHPGFPVTDDGNWMIIRLSGFYQSFKDGQVPVRFIGRLNHEYGYPVSNFLYPGYLYLGSIFHIVGFSFINSIKFLIATCIVVSGFFCFLWLRRFFSSSVAFVGALFYVYSPYLLFDIYTRGSVGEVLALSIVPLFFYAVEKNSLFFSSVAIASLILSHNILALLFIPVFCLYLILRNKQIMPSILYGFSISSFFWVPAIWDLQYVRFSSTTISDWSVYFLKDYTLVGLQLFFILILSLYFLKKKKDSLGIFFLIISIGSLLLSSAFSTVLWTTFPIGKYIQFPWRFLSLLIPGSAYLTAFVLSRMERSSKVYIAVAGILIFFLFWGAKTRISTISYSDKTDDYYATNDDTTTVSNEYMPIYVQNDAQNRPSARAEVIGKGEIVKQNYTTRKYSVQVLIQKESLLQFNTVYFPGWQATIDRVDTSVSRNENGLMQIHLTKPGLSSILLEYKQSGIHAISNAISVLSMSLLGIWYLYDLRKQKKKS